MNEFDKKMAEVFDVIPTKVEEKKKLCQQYQKIQVNQT